jgi:hypothetical protein
MAAVTLDAIWSALRGGRHIEREAEPALDGPPPGSDPLPGERFDEPAMTS